ncbi:MAG: DUF5103 domain-containing protein [Prevotella sp.]
MEHISGIHINIIRSALFLFMFLLSIPVFSQRNEILNDRIATLQVVAGDDWTNPPVIKLDEGETVRIAFDDLTHDYHRYTYKLEHCEADWTPSTELFESDFVEGFAEGNTIDDNEQSINTNQLYTHYQLEFPNDDCKLKLSGNYRVTVYDEEEDHSPVLVACFMVYENSMELGISATSLTDKDVNGRHQQLGMTLNFGTLSVTDPHQQIRTVVTQNGRWDNAVINAQPQYVRADGLIWDHCRDLIFDSGNEYRKFETLDLDHTTMGVERIEWNGSQYTAHIWTDEPRPNYVYDEDADGAFYIRNSDNVENDISTDYLNVHFRLKSPRLQGQVYLNGAWTNDRFLPAYEMHWNDIGQLYEASVWMKQGYYNYQYLWMKPDGTLTFVPSEGNFFETENRYDAYVYYRETGGRTDRLVGYVQCVLK